jgi:hypothetical protein
MQNEIWKDIPNYEGKYQVSNLGNVRLLKNDNFKLLSLHIMNNGYYAVNLRNDIKQKIYTNHSLVAMAFLGHKPNGHKIVVDHIDNNKLNNTVENLQLITNRENISRQKAKTSKYTGVSWCKRKNKWKAQITINKKTLNLGRYKCELKAHLAYKKMLKSIL